MKIYVWGVGCGAGELIEKGFPEKKITAFVDSFYAGEHFHGKPVIKPERLREEQFDLILVTARQSGEIARTASAYGVPPEKLLFLKNNVSARDMNTSYETAKRALGEELTEALRPHCRIMGEPPWKSALPERELENDCIRLLTLEALCAELRRRQIEGAAAELGVYKGSFARCINLLMPERALYLFDSFEGFDAREAEEEKQRGRINEVFLEAHKNTAAEVVLQKMPHPERVIIKAGFFPESARAIDEHFSLASIDVDLEGSILEGLRWFYPRMAEGGYILLHDYNAPKLGGVRAAVREFERELGRPLTAAPLCDVGGSLLICK